MPAKFQKSVQFQTSEKKIFRTQTLLPVVLFFLLFQSASLGQVLKPVRAENPPLLDGVLDDAVWIECTPVSEFKTFSPDFGKDAAEKTLVYSAYDSDNLYFGYKCFDTEPDKIKASITSRDNIVADDWICLNIDTFNDQQSLYAFYINPFGIQMDSRYANKVEDPNVDLVWYSAGKLDDDGYTVEFTIPLKSIRFDGSDTVRMSVFFERKINRFSEHSSWPEFDPKKGFSFMTQMAEIEYNNLNTHRIMELLPAVTYSNRSKFSAGKLENYDNSGELSLTGKIGITPQLILDGTYNPDFSQIEADAGQVDVNLRYNLFFPEKRPFFLEGNEIFKLAGTRSSEIDDVRSIVHTRNIVNPITGLKLSGKVSANLTVASIYAIDELEPNLANDDFAHFGILRMKRSLWEDSFIGGIYTGRELKSGYNRVGGMDGFFRIGDSKTIEFNGLLSKTKSPNDIDSQLEHLFSFKFAEDSRDLEYALNFKNISQKFNVESGYISRNGYLRISGLIKPKIYPSSDYISRLDLEAFSAQTKDKFSGEWETNNWGAVTSTFKGNFLLKVKYSYSTEIFLNERFKTGGFHIFGGGWPVKQIYIGALYRRIGAIYYSQSPFQGYGNRLSTNLAFQPSEKLQADLSFIYFDFYRDSDSEKIYEYPISRLALTYQFNQYLFFRGIVEKNNYKKELLTDFLLSFTYIPGTVFHLGYGSLYEKTKWEANQLRPGENFLETKRGFFLKVSYLWRN